MGFREPDRNTSSNSSVLRTVTDGSSLLNRVTGGLHELYKRIDPRQRQTSTANHVEGSCTASNGVFLIDKAPLLANRYHILEVIGKGSFGVIAQAVDTFQPDRCHVAIKIMDVHNRNLGFQEANYMQLLNCADPHDCVHIIRLLNVFNFDGHVCLVYELLSSLHLHHKLEMIPRTADYKRKKLKVIRKITIQLMVMLQFLSRMNVIHTDLKPDNILQVSSSGRGCDLKIIDFGNAIHCTDSEIQPYMDDFNLQSLWYRAPEVVLGVGISLAIDMWSVGCILIELFFGRPLFVAETREDLIESMTILLGDMPKIPLSKGKFSSSAGQHFTTSICNQGEKLYTVFQKANKAGQEEREFASFLGTLLCYDPDFRATPSEALKHPFLKSLFPQRYLTASCATYPICNHFALPPQRETELMQRLGVGSLLRLTSLSPMKGSVVHRVVQGCTRASSQESKPKTTASLSVMMSPHTEVTSSTQCDSESTLVAFKVSTEEPDISENREILNEEPDIFENCEVQSENSDDVLLIKSLDQPSAHRNIEKHSEQSSYSTATEFFSEDQKRKTKVVSQTRKRSHTLDPLRKRKRQK